MLLWLLGLLIEENNFPNINIGSTTQRVMRIRRRKRFRGQMWTSEEEFSVSRSKNPRSIIFVVGQDICQPLAVHPTVSRYSSVR